ncbi:hypothetical protein [Kitasatospora sp. NPDC088351]|uniref:hypothetical protein n=1 Tax=Kitasatospora sp. NPDC088351 TaxID=3155180 RepID=UPI003429E769
MNETRPRGEEQDAAGWDGVERRTQRGRWSAWRSPERLRAQVLAGMTRRAVEGLFLAAPVPVPPARGVRRDA